VALVQGDAERLPFRGGFFDAAVSVGVLHHTPETAEGVKEIHRLLKPGGLAIVMLYRRGNPKWWLTRLLRGVSQSLRIFTGKSSPSARKFGAGRRPAQAATGTALLELFGVPVMKAFTNRQALKMFDDFADVRISNHQPGFRRMADVLPLMRPFRSGLGWIDRRLSRRWGFYQVIEARKSI
jgi:SAM-dependent methyltransferase